MGVFTSWQSTLAGLAQQAMRPGSDCRELLPSKPRRPPNLRSSQHPLIRLERIGRCHRCAQTKGILDPVLFRAMNVPFQRRIFASYCHVLPVLDLTIFALVTDLEVRGLIDDVLVVVLDEFDRTPKVSYPRSGREHWADAGCVLMDGGGLRMGQVVGEPTRGPKEPRAATSRSRT